ncbi:cupredoxin domain-containing protein [Granulicella tundricola]|nr:hypothetical protein [Granulicella tundricola]
MKRCGLVMAAAAGMAHAQGATVDLRVNVESHRMNGAKTADGATEQVIAWLTPMKTDATHPPVPAHGYVLTQKNKMFTPHLLVVPTGSSVEFPNLDPFFHNVFSLFNGRRFDLGLYEAGSRRSVRFDHDGVSYIFCNIHPEMGAVIVSLSTPYYSVSRKDGSLAIANVPAGDYELNVWAENVSAADLAAARQNIHVSEQGLRLPAMTLQASSSMAGKHLNKFGEEYKKSDQDPY